MTDPIAIQRLKTLGDATEPAYLWYRETFREINNRAMQRHVMYRQEFADMADDSSIIKLMAQDVDGKPLGMAVLTNNLVSWPLIAPEYFAEHWPVHTRESRIWYIGFVGVSTRTPNTKRIHLFSRFVALMYNIVVANEGMSFMDFCTWNVDRKQIPQITHKLLSHIDAQTRGGLVDAQQFWGWRYDGKDLFDVTG